MMKALKEAMTTTEPGLKVIVAESECQLALQRRVRPLIRERLAKGRRVVRTRFGVDPDTCTGDHSCIRLSGCPTLTVRPNPDPLRTDPIAYVEDGCVGCGLCGEVAEAAALCPSFYRAEIIQNPNPWDRLLYRVRRAVIGLFEGAAPRFAKSAILDDLAALAEGVASQINAVLLGAIAGCGVLPMPADNFRAAIRDKGVAVDANLRGFDAGLARAAPEPEVKTDSALDAFPAGVAEILAAGVARVTDHQDVAYGRLYLERLAPIRDLEEDAPPELLRETGRQLALWMAYEDVIRVAQLKTRRGRHARVRGEVRAKPGEPVRVAEYFAPGADEIAAILPAWLGRALLAWGGNWRMHLRLRSDTVIGFLLMRLLATFRPMRTMSLRYGEEQALIERWLDAVRRAAEIDVGLALEVVECAGLNKGYGDTFTYGRANFLSVLGQIVEPVLTGAAPAEGAAERVALARRAALADPDGAALGEILGGTEAPKRSAAE